MISSIQEAVLAANLRLAASGLVHLTWGNVSGLDRDRGVFYIKPSGIDYAKFVKFVATNQALKTVVAFDAVGVTGNKNA